MVVIACHVASAPRIEGSALITTPKSVISSCYSLRFQKHAVGGEIGRKQMEQCT